ncbi:rod shape-determining protein MreD [Pontixanthobacter gangjinensis]|uniref:Rod shape-determining protein MreD n=1 Tax=Pontixanthobacter gangjinensis TaxID=1028742 RepID=A0A6I4SPI7_9SPHN|nr:rod shape-determining protein MreD [Pontixanthobacter gangjinensis]MXO57060.1 rod shape-determining protein MreD [Pontixanthobacter gangjinensis]
MDQINPHSRSDEYGSRINRAHSPFLVIAIPILSILLSSILPMLPIASAVPIMPPLGLLCLLAWRIVRPGLLPVWVGFPLGAFDDLFSGQPFGSAILLWSISMIAIEIIEARFPWRTFVQDWLMIIAIIISYLLAAALFSGAPITVHGLIALGPQLLLCILLFPIIARMIARLDRLRLRRFKRIGVIP